MAHARKLAFLVVALSISSWTDVAGAEEKAVVGLIPKAQKPIQMDGDLDDWERAFVTPVHIGHPDFANRGGEFLFLWDDQNLYIGLRCLDQKPANMGSDQQIWNGDAVEFYLDTRRENLGARAFGPGTLHMFWTPFTKREIAPRMQIRPMSALKGLKLQGAEIAGKKHPWGYTAEFKLPWANFPAFKPQAGEVIGIDCELCSSDGGPRVDRTFVYSSPLSVSTPSAFGRVQLVDKLGPDLKPFGRVLLPLALTKSANYPWLYGTVCISPTIEKAVGKVEGNIVKENGKVLRGPSEPPQVSQVDGFRLWRAKWELSNLPPGDYTLKLTAYDKEGQPITERTVKLPYGDNPAP